MVLHSKNQVINEVDWRKTIFETFILENVD